MFEASTYRAAVPVRALWPWAQAFAETVYSARWRAARAPGVQVWLSLNRWVVRATRLAVGATRPCPCRQLQPQPQ